MGTIYKWTGKKQSFIDIFPSVRDFAFKSFTVEFYEGLKKSQYYSIRIHCPLNYKHVHEKKVFVGVFVWIVLTYFMYSVLLFYDDH